MLQIQLQNREARGELKVEWLGKTLKNTEQFIYGLHWTEPERLRSSVEKQKKSKQGITYTENL